MRVKAGSATKKRAIAPAAAARPAQAASGGAAAPIRTSSRATATRTRYRDGKTSSFLSFLFFFFQ